MQMRSVALSVVLAFSGLTPPASTVEVRSTEQAHHMESALLTFQAKESVRLTALLIHTMAFKAVVPSRR